MANKKDTVSDVQFIQQLSSQPQFPYGNPPDFLFYGLKTYIFRRVKTSGSSTVPGLPSKYFRPHLVNRRRFQPACCFTAGKSDARRNLLKPVTEFTSVQRMQTKLTTIFSKGCVLHFSNNSRSPAVAAYRLTPELSSFSHIWDKLASISLNGKCCRSSNNSRLRKLSLYFLT